jgi:hypothetical protein
MCFDVFVMRFPKIEFSLFVVFFLALVVHVSVNRFTDGLHSILKPRTAVSYQSGASIFCASLPILHMPS